MTQSKDPQMSTGQLWKQQGSGAISAAEILIYYLIYVHSLWGITSAELEQNVIL